MCEAAARSGYPTIHWGYAAMARTFISFGLDQPHVDEGSASSHHPQRQRNSLIVEGEAEAVARQLNDGGSADVLWIPGANR